MALAMALVCGTAQRESAWCPRVCRRRAVTASELATPAGNRSPPAAAMLWVSNPSAMSPAARSRRGPRKSARAVLSCPVQYLDGAVAAVDPDPVAAVQEHGRVAASTTAGMPSSRATIAAWDSGAPTSVTTAAARGKIGVQPMLVTVATRISPSLNWGANSGERNTRALPSTTPAAPGNPVIVSSGLVVWARSS